MNPLEKTKLAILLRFDAERNWEMGRTVESLDPLLAGNYFARARQIAQTCDQMAQKPEHRPLYHAMGPGLQRRMAMASARTFRRKSVDQPSASHI
jgi:hypothetical protein